MAELSSIAGPAPEPSEERRDSDGGADAAADGGGGGEIAQVMVDSTADGGGPSSLMGMGPPSPLTGCYLLIVLGEPHSAEHKDVILQRLIKGFLSWNMSENHVDLEEELNTITINAPEGENARHGERLIQYASENLVTEILIHPQYNTLIQCMRNLLSSFTRHRHIIHAGYTFSGNGSWILQDGTFSVSDFSEAFQEHEVQRVLRAYPDTVSMDIHCDGSSGLWSALPDKSFVKSCKIRINPKEVLSVNSEQVNSFIDYLAPMLAPANLDDLLESSDVVGNIRFSHPTLYVFPGGQGDAALFGINGFNMLVDGGFNRKACFWDFARHLDRLDAVLMTRVNNSNIQGISSVIERKKNAYVYPQIGHFFCNIPERRNLISPESDRAKDSLVVDLMDRGQDMVANLKSINLKPQTCYRDVEPMNLYHKVGHGTLDMYVISPSKDSKEVKEFMQKWTTNDQRLFAAKESKDFQFPIQNLVSICALLVWQPANPDDSITRILFPGSTPDFKIIEGLEKVKHLEFMKHPICSAKKLTSSISTAVLTKKTLKSILPEAAYPPIKTSKFPDSQPADNKTDIMQSDNKIKESKLIEEVAEKKIAGKVKSKKMAEDKPRAGSTEKIDSKAESHDEKKDDATDADETKKDDVKPRVKKIEAKSAIRSKIDSKPPKSTIEKKPKKDVGKSSPTSTPKKMTNGVAAKDKEVKPKPIGRPARISPSSTPAKSTKEANNRKVLESKQQKTTTSTKTVTKREISSKVTTDKKDTKPERKPISYRSAKSMSPSRRAAGSPVKSVKPKTERDHIIRKAKLDRGGTTDSSLVSTPSGIDDVTKKIVGGGSVDGSDLDKQRELDELKEEQEAVREIEAVFKREEKSKQKIILSDHREIAKQDSTTEAEDDEEYLIIEKEEVEQYTEDSINEPESSLTKEEEIQKHQRDSQESEKKRKTSLETTEEEVEPKESKAVEGEKSTEGDGIQPDSIEATGEQPIQDEAKETDTREIATTKSDVAAEITSSPSPDDKLSSNKKTSDTKDEMETGAPLETKEGEAIHLPESQPFSTTIESGATTAPTLPEDERITLDEIKEDLAVEEKLTKEETAKSEEIVVEAPLPPLETKPAMRVLPAKMHFDIAQQSAHLRDVVKTPDEVADLPVHEEADIGTYEASEEAKDDKMISKEKMDKIKLDLDGTEEDTMERKVMSPISKSPMVEHEKATSDDVEAAEEVMLKDSTSDGDKEKYVKEDKEEDEDEEKDIDADDEDEDDAVEHKEEVVPSPVQHKEIATPKTSSPTGSEKPDHISPTLKTPEPKSPKDQDADSARTSPSILVGKKVEDKLTDLKEKIDGVTVEKVEYALEDLGKGFETTLKDVTQKTKTSEQVSEPDTSADEEGDLHEKLEEAAAADAKEISEETAAAFKEVYDYSHPFGVKSFPTELRETHITTLDSPVSADKDRCIEIKVLEQLVERDEDLEPQETTTIPSVTTFYTDEYPFDRDETNLNDIKEEDEEDRYSASNKSSSRKPSREICDLFADKDVLNDVLGSIDGQPPRSVSPREVEVLKIVANVAEVLKSEKDIIEIIPDFSEEELEKKLHRASPRIEEDGTTVQRMLVTASSEDGGEEIEICPEGSIKFTSSPSPTPSGKLTPTETTKEEFDFKSDDIASSEKDKPTSASSTPDANISTVSIEEKDKVELSEKQQKQIVDEEIIFPTTTTIDVTSAAFPTVKGETSSESHEKLEEKLTALKDTTTTMLPDVSSKLVSTEISSRKESVISDYHDDLDSRRESAISTLSEKDITKDESSIEDSRPPSAISHDTKIDDTTAAENESDVVATVTLTSKPEEKTLKEPTKITEPSDVKHEATDEETRRESASSQVSEKSPKDVSRPESIISHFSDQTEPELKEPMGIRAKSPDFDISRPESTDITDITEKEVLEEVIVISEELTKTQSTVLVDKSEVTVAAVITEITSRSESVTSHTSDKAKETPSHSVSSVISDKSKTPSETQEISRPVSVHSDKEVMEESPVQDVKSPKTSEHSTSGKDDKKSSESKETSRPASVQSHISGKDSTQPDQESLVKSPTPVTSHVTEKSAEKTPSESKESSRPASVQSHVSEIPSSGDPTKDISRPSSILAGEEKSQIVSRPESELSEKSHEQFTVLSRPESQLSHVSEKAIIDHESPVSRPVSVQSHVSIDDSKSKRDSEASHKEEISTDDLPSRKTSPTPSAMSLAKDTQATSRPESSMSETKQTEIVSRPVSDLSHAEEVDSKSRRDSEASHKEEASADDLTSHKASPTPSVMSSAKDTQDISRPVSSMSETKQTEIVSRPVSGLSHAEEGVSKSTRDSEASHKEEASADDLTARKASPTPSVMSSAKDTQDISRPVSSISETKQTEIMSRPVSGLSHAEEVDSKSRQDSEASHKEEASADDLTSHKASPTPSVMSSAKDTQDISRPVSSISETNQTEIVSRPVSGLSHAEEVDSKSRRDSEASHKDEASADDLTSHKASPTPSVKSSAKDTQDISRPVSSMSETKQTEIVSRPVSGLSHAEEVDSKSRRDSEASHKEEASADDLTSHKASPTPSVMSSAKDTQDISRPVSSMSETKQTEIVSRPVSGLSHAEEVDSKSRRDSEASHKDEASADDLKSHKASPTPSVMSSAKDTQDISRPVSSMSETKQTEIVSRPVSGLSHAEEVDSKSRRDSEASHKDEASADDLTSHKASPTPSVMSSAKDTQDISRPVSSMSETKQTEIVSRPVSGLSHAEEVDSKSRRDSEASHKEEASADDLTSHKASPTPSVMSSAKDTQDISRPVSSMSETKQTEIVSRPVSGLSHAEEVDSKSRRDSEASHKDEASADDLKSHKASPTPSVMSSAKDTQDISRPVSSMSETKQTEIVSRPVSGLSHAEEVDSKARRDSEASHKEEVSADDLSSLKALTSPSEMSSSDKTAKDTQDMSRPISSMSETKQAEDVLKTDVHSRPESVASKKDDVSVSKLDSRPVSALSQTSETHEDKDKPTKDSRTPSLVSLADEEKGVTSRPLSVASHAEDIKEAVSETVSEDKMASRPESVLSHQSDQVLDKIQEAASTPGSVISHKDEPLLKESKDTSRPESGFSHTSEKDIGKAIEQGEISRPESSASQKDYAEKGAKTPSIISSRPESVMSNTSEKDTTHIGGETAPRPESVASHKEDVHTDTRSPSMAGSVDEKITVEAQDISRPESVVSQKSEISKPTGETSRPLSVESHQEEIIEKSRAPSIVSTQSEKQLHETELSSRPESVISHTEDPVEHVSRPESRTPSMVSSNIDDKLVQETRAQYVLSQQSEHDKTQTEDSIRPESATSHQDIVIPSPESTLSKTSDREKESSEIKDSFTRPESAISHKDEPFSRPLSALESGTDAQKSRPESALSDKEEKSGDKTLDTKDHSRPASALSDIVDKETNETPSVATIIEEEAKIAEQSRPESVLSHTDETGKVSPLPSKASKQEDVDIKGSRPVSVLSHTSDQGIEEKTTSIAVSALSHTSEQISRPESVAEHKVTPRHEIETEIEAPDTIDARPDSVASDKEGTVEVPQQGHTEETTAKPTKESRSASIASSIGVKASESISGSRPVSAMSGTEKETEVTDSASVLVEKPSQSITDIRSVSALSHTEIETEIIDTTSKDSARPESSMSAISGKAEVVSGLELGHLDETHVSRPVSAQSHASDLPQEAATKHEALAESETSHTDEPMRPMSSLSQMSDKNSAQVIPKDSRSDSITSQTSKIKSTEPSRPSSVLSHASEEEMKNQEVITAESRSGSMSSQKTDQITSSLKITTAETESRPSSQLSDKGSETSVDKKSIVGEKQDTTSKGPSRPESGASQVCEVRKDDSTTASRKESIELSRPTSKLSHASKGDLDKPFESDTDKLSEPKEESRPASGLSIASEKESLTEQAVHKTSSRTESVASKDESLLVTTNEKGDQEKISRSPSIVSNVTDKSKSKEEKDTSRPDSRQSDMDKEIHVSRPASEAKCEIKDSRPVSSLSQTSSQNKETDQSKDTGSRALSSAEGTIDDLPATNNVSRPVSSLSHTSEKLVDQPKETTRSPSVVSSIPDLAKESSRPESCLGLDTKVASRSESIVSAQSEVVKDSRSASVISSAAGIPGDLSRPVSSLSQASGTAKVLESRPQSVIDESQDRPGSAASQQAELTGDSHSPSVTSHHDESKSVSRPTSVASHKESDDKDVVLKTESRPVSSLSHASIRDMDHKSTTDTIPRPESVSSHKEAEVGYSSRPVSSLSYTSDCVSKELDSALKDVSRPASSISNIIEKDIVKHSSEIPSRSNSVTSHTSDQEPARSQSRRESAIDRSIYMEMDDEVVTVKDTRSKSVSSIMMTSMYKPEGLEPLAAFEEDYEHTKDVDVETFSSRITSSVTELVQTGKVLSKDDEADHTDTLENDRLSTETNISGKSSPTSDSKVASKPGTSASDPLKLSTDSDISGRSTPDIAEVDTRGKLDIGQSVKDQSGMSSPFTQNTISDSISIGTSLGHGSETSTSSPQPTSPFPKGIGSLKNEETISTPDITRVSTPEADLVEGKVVSTTTSTTTTTIGSVSHIETNEATSTHSVDSKTPEPQSTRSEISSSESQATTKDVLTHTTTAVTLIKSEFRSFTPTSDDYDLSSPRAQGYIAGSDDEIEASPLSATSHAAHSPTSKFSYEHEYELQRSSSSKTTELDIDDSQDDIPPEYGSHEVETAIPVTSAYKPDPMSTSFYGKLPESSPIPISVRTVITKQYDDYTSSSGPESGASQGSDHRFLEEADQEFEKALEEHIQLRGSDVMSSVTSKYAFSPSKEELLQKSYTAAKEFQLEDVLKPKQPEPELTTTTITQQSQSHSSTTSATSEAVGTSTTVTSQQLSKEEVDAIVTSWGKPLGLPSPVDAQTTPKRERRIVLSKTKLNNEKNLRKRSESPGKAKKITPIYMDLTYVPHNGNSYYSHVEFFKRIRARYYVFSGTEPSRDVYNALLEAKQTWEDKDLEVTIIPTYDTDVLGYWVSENEDLLAKYHIDLSPSASRCTINLQDHETSCSAYRLEF